MKEKLKKTLLLALFAMIIIQVASFAHSGRTDKYGGHKDNQNKSGLGSYHYHCGGYPAHLHTNGVCPYSGSGNSSSNSSNSSTKSNSTNKSNYNNTTNNSKNSTTVKPAEVLVQNVEIQNKANFSELMVGESVKLNAIVQPENATSKDITWTSSNEQIAIVDSSGEVQAISEGKVTITAKSNNSKQDSLNLVIKRKPILVEKISINNSVSTMNVGDELNLDIICTPENADNKEHTVNSSNTDVINVEANKIKAVASGKATITVTSRDGNATNSFDITVIDVKIEEDANEGSVESKSSSNVNASDSSSDGSGGTVVALLGMCGIGGYALYRKNKNNHKIKKD